jgi:hypothetical protein
MLTQYEQTYMEKDPPKAMAALDGNHMPSSSRGAPGFLVGEREEASYVIWARNLQVTA